eukprot:1630656-Amphidinium_carterae.2
MTQDIKDDPCVVKAMKGVRRARNQLWFGWGNYQSAAGVFDLASSRVWGGSKRLVVQLHFSCLHSHVSPSLSQKRGSGSTKDCCPIDP